MGFEIPYGKREVEFVKRAKDLLADPEFEIVLNITVPKAHAKVALYSLRNHKQSFNQMKGFYVEKTS